MRIRNTAIFWAGISPNSFLYPVALAASILLSACAGSSATQAQKPKPPKREYVVYRIDDHRYITIESRYPCINGQIDGEIYYYDTHQNIRTPVAYTGDADNGLYLGYYAIHGESSYVAIPSLSFSQTSGMRLHINYSHDGGRTFQWFTIGADTPHNALIMDRNSLYVSLLDFDDEKKYSNASGTIFDLKRDASGDPARYSPAQVFQKYGRHIPRDQVPFDLKSSSGATHWICPSSAEK
jgi:hypothetical protein